MNNTPVIKLSNDGSVAMVGGRFTTRGFSIFKNGLRQSTGADEFFYENGSTSSAANNNYQALEVSDDGHMLFFGDSNLNTVNVWLHNPSGSSSSNTTYTLQSNEINSSALQRFGANIGLFENTHTNRKLRC